MRNLLRHKTGSIYLIAAPINFSISAIHFTETEFALENIKFINKEDRVIVTVKLIKI